MKFLKRIAVFLFVVLLTMANLPMTANAATEGTTTTIDKTYRCVKNSDIGIAGTAPIGDSRFYWHYNAAGTALNSPIRFMKEKGTSMPVYCIEMGASFESSNFLTEKLTDSKFWNSLSATAQRGITYTTMYGYPVNNYGAANCDAYVATQTIIWEFQKGYRTLSGRNDAALYDLMIKGSPAENAYNRLAAAITAHSTRPSFSFNTLNKAQTSPIELKYDSASKTWAVTLTDSNGVLSGYSISSDGGLDVSKLENTLTISTEKPVSESAQITLERPLPTKGQSLLALYSTVNQNCIIGQLNDPVTSYISIETEAVDGKVSVTKENEKGEKLAGVVFGVYSEEDCTNKITEMTTGGDGTAISGDINIREYPVVYVKELSITDDQKELYSINPTVYKVTLTAGETVSANGGDCVINKWLPGKISLNKITPSKTHVEGAVFKAYLDADLKKEATDINGEPVILTTDKNGNAVSENINMDAGGTKKLYVIETEITTPIGQALVVSDTVYEVILTPNKTNSINSGEPIVNEWHDGKLSLTKVNENGEPLEGVIFGVFSDENCVEKIEEIITDQNGYASSGEITVNKDGTRIVYVKELSMTSSDSNIYELNTKVYTVKLNAGKTSYVNGGEAIVNKFKTVPVKIRKSDFTTAEGVAGAWIEIFDSTGKLVYKGVTLEDGNTEAVELRVGSYTFTETIAPAGYILNKSVFNFTVNPDRTVTGSCEITDKPTEWTITKIDLITAEPITGAEITIYDADGNEVFRDITKENGTVTAFYLSAGTYKFKETAAPEGYVLNKEVFTFTVDEDGTVTGDNNITNRRIIGSIKVVKIDEDTDEHLAGAVFGLFSADSETMLAESTTGDDGTVTFADLEYGDYVIKELKAPEGYEMTAHEFQVNIKSDGKTIELRISNIREPMVPQTGESIIPTVIAVILILLSSAGMFWLIYPKIHKQIKGGNLNEN